ncbi:hypothetical protein ACIA5D_20835 [Actinoplanes sp. NPDC051513]|uniref:hypothetical protein n=1 Tax=Actinoplanes sp. NPDC051513 TaxID=3363908 RepID=UPI0037B5E6FE
MNKTDHGRRRLRMAIGVTGLAALLGTGAFLVTDRATRDAGTTAEVAPPPATMVRHSSTRADEQSRPVEPEKAAASASPKSVRERANAARDANQRLGTEVRHPLSVAGQVDPAAVQVRQVGSNAAGRTLRVSSARQDLTGYRELAWARNGRAVGSATCTQTFTPSANVPARERPTMLLCWRLSAKKSVYTLAVDTQARPSMAASVAEIGKAWAALR